MLEREVAGDLQWVVYELSWPYAAVWAPLLVLLLLLLLMLLRLLRYS
jgi:hypothetical protein